jgi:hypothetical protein
MIFNQNQFKPVVRFGKEIPGYYVSKDGKVFNSRTNKLLKLGADYSKRSGRLEALKFTVSLDSNFFEDYSYYKHKNKSNNCQITCRVHKAVMDTWKPIENNPPEQLKETWNEVPEEWREWVIDTAYIDHIDDDPTNNHVDNLRWVTPKQNCKYRKKQELEGSDITFEIPEEQYTEIENLIKKIGSDESPEQLLVRLIKEDYDRQFSVFKYD